MRSHARAHAHRQAPLRDDAAQQRRFLAVFLHALTDVFAETPDNPLHQAAAQPDRVATLLKDAPGTWSELSTAEVRADSLYWFFRKAIDDYRLFERSRTPSPMC